jgi:hypothetical protein
MFTVGQGLQTGNIVGDTPQPTRCRRSLQARPSRPPGPWQSPERMERDVVPIDLTLGYLAKWP